MNTELTVSEQIDKLNGQIAVMDSYIRMMLDRKDFHAVFDGCVDMQVLLARLEIYKKLND